MSYRLTRLRLTRRQAEVVLKILNEDIAGGDASEPDRDLVVAARDRISDALDLVYDRIDRYCGTEEDA